MYYVKYHKWEDGKLVSAGPGVEFFNPLIALKAVSESFLPPVLKNNQPSFENIGKVECFSVNHVRQWSLTID